MTLYLKYRPRNLDELDLKDVGNSLKEVIKSGKIPHAFLFAGPKGTGKTSAARILAKIINCESSSREVRGKDMLTPCDECEACKSISNGSSLDVVEMDAASHRGIDDIRALKEAVKLAATSSKKKIYIIDEAHMLTLEASNALLKTLEEPPDHVIFILATTNPEKLIDTIRSRTTLVQFRKATDNEIANSLKRVADSEKINVSESDILLIARRADGAFRDAIKILEQVASEGSSYLSRFAYGDAETFLEYLGKKDAKSAISIIEDHVKRGLSAADFLVSVVKLLHQLLLSQVGLQENKAYNLNLEDISKLNDMLSIASGQMIDSPVDELPLELVVIKWCSEGGGGDIKKDNPARVSEGGKAGANSVKASAEPALLENKTEEVKMDTLVNVVRENGEGKSSESVSLEINSEIWKNILSGVKPVNASIEGLLRSSKPVHYDGKTLTLGVYYAFHKERLEDVRHRKILEEVLAKVLNTPTRIHCTLIDPPPKKVVDTAKFEPVLTEGKDPDIIKAAKEIFGN